MSEQHEQNDEINNDVPADEINEEELDNVSGGFNPQPDPPGRYRLINNNPILPPTDLGGITGNTKGQ